MTMRIPTYQSVNAATWDEIMAGETDRWTPPRTVHLPIQPVHSRDFIHVDGSLNVCRRRVLPGLSGTRPEDKELADRLETMIVQLLPADPPFVPQDRACRFTLEEGRYPVVTAEVFADCVYRFTLFCAPGARAGQNRLWITGTVVNPDARRRRATVRARVGFASEGDLFEYHYIPFYWDATKYRHPTRAGLREGWVLREEKPVGRVVPGSFDCEWEPSASFSAGDYERLAATYFAEPAHRFSELTECLVFRRELEPGEEASFSLVLLADYEAADPADLDALKALTASAEKERAVAHFRSHFADGITRFDCPARDLEPMFAELQISTLQLMTPFAGYPGLAPTQGGTSERHFVWVWEAVFMLQPLLKLGRFQTVRAGLDFLFSLQDGGFPPDGRFTTLQGAIGTTGPRWVNSTGSALALAADYYRYSGDEAFLREYLPNILRAADWIVGELRATRCLNADGSRPPAFGLMPFGRATDGDNGHAFAFTDAYTFWGLDKTALLLRRIGHPRFAEFERERDLYRADIESAVTRAVRPDGYIERKIVTGDPDEYFADGFERLCSVAHLAYVGALSTESALFDRYTAYIEEHLADNAFLARMNSEIFYMGVLEFLWQQVYLRRGEWKKAFLAARVNLRYGMTQDTFQVQERFSISNPDFVPWQPNGSGNGRVLEMILSSFYFENAERDVTLLGGCPFVWLRANRHTALGPLHTPRGTLSLEADMASDACRVRLHADDPAALPARICIPEHFAVTEVTGAVREPATQWFSLKQGVREIALVLEDNGSSRAVTTADPIGDEGRKAR